MNLILLEYFPFRVVTEYKGIDVAANVQLLRSEDGGLGHCADRASSMFVIGGSNYKSPTRDFSYTTNPLYLTAASHRFAAYCTNVGTTMRQMGKAAETGGLFARSRIVLSNLGIALSGHASF